MRLSHYSDSRQVTPYSVQQPERPDFKPKGLWVSVDGEDDWPTWCRDNEFGLGDYRHRVTLARDVLVLDTVEAVVRFTDRFGTDRRVHASLGESVDYIDWRAVAARYPGIIIAPYHGALRLSWYAHWYYPWDCASGCIWDADAIQSVTLMTESIPQT